MRWIWMTITLALAGIILAIPESSKAADFVVYGVHKDIDYGNPGEVPQKDYYVNLGSSQGARVGSVLEVLRHAPTYDLLTQKLYKEITFPIARLKVIHAENGAAVARLEKMLPFDKTPIGAPQAVMVGDLVRLSE